MESLDVRVEYYYHSLARESSLVTETDPSLKVLAIGSRPHQELWDHSNLQLRLGRGAANPEQPAQCLEPAQNTAVHPLMSVQGRIAVQIYLDLQPWRIQNVACFQTSSSAGGRNRA